MDAPVLFGREDVLADGQVVVRAIDEFEGKHANALPMIATPVLFPLSSWVEIPADL